MLRVDFYILNQPGQAAEQQCLCRIVEKALAREHRLLIRTDSAANAKQIDDLLWTYNDISFLPHAVIDDAKDPAAIPILITYQPELPPQPDILINLSTTTHPKHQAFHRIIEIVAADTQAKEQSRDHFRFYRDQQYDIHTHNL